MKTSPKTNFRQKKWKVQDSNLRPFARQASALPAELTFHRYLLYHIFRKRQAQKAGFLILFPLYIPHMFSLSILVRNRHNTIPDNSGLSACFLCTVFGDYTVSLAFWATAVDSAMT